MVRRYESADGSEYDYGNYQARSSGYGVSRYEVGRQSLQSLQNSVRAKRLIVYTNGEKPQKSNKFSNSDKYKTPPVQIVFSKKKFPQLAPLFEEITRLTKRKALRLFKWPSGTEVCHVSEIEEEDESNIYVCSNEKALVHTIPYARIEFGGSPTNEKYSRTSHDSRGTLRSEKASPKAMRSLGPVNGGSKVPPVKIEVTSNTHRDSTCSIIVDTRSHQEFEKVLETIDDMIEVESPITSLYSKVKPYKKVESYSTLNMVMKTYGKSFWACGAEGPPAELKSRSRDVSPMRNGQQKQRYGKKQPEYDDYRSRQTDGHARQQEQYEDSYGRPYQRHQDQYDDDNMEQDETDHEVSPPPAARGGRRNDPSPRRDNKPNNRQVQMRDDDEDHHGNARGGNKSDRNRQKRQQTPPPSKDDNKRGKRDDGESEEERDEREEEDEREDDREREHPSEEEMRERIEKMERADSKLDKDVHY